MTGAKVPRHPRRPLRYEPIDVTAVQPVLWRIHSVRGPHPAAWNIFRHYGPIPGMRWEPHPQPEGDHPGYGISYAAADIATAVAEVFQRTRIVRPSPDRHLTSWTPVRPLRLLDLTGDWALRNRGAYALASSPKSTCRNWANAIRVDFPGLDGLWTHSTLTGAGTTVLFEPASDSFPATPAFSHPLDAAPVWLLLRDIAAAIGFQFR